MIQELEITGLYGPGALTIQVADDAEVTVQMHVIVRDCSILITLDGLKIIGNKSEAGAILAVINVPYIIMNNCTIDREKDQTHKGICVELGTNVLLQFSRITHCDPAIHTKTGSFVCAVSCTGEHNNYGIFVEGSIVMLQGSTPELMGAANKKLSGLIVKSDGTLL